MKYSALQTQLFKLPGKGLALAATGALLLSGFVCIGGGETAGRFPAYIPYDSSQNEIAEGVAVDKVGNVYVSIGGMSGPRGEIYKYTPSGEKSVLIDFGTPGVGGLAVDAIGNVYVTRMVPPHNGVYRVDPQGNAVRLPGTEKIVFPNALAFDSEGNLFVTETFSFDPPLRQYPGLAIPYGLGGIWCIPKKGDAELWLRHELLSGTGLFASLFPFPVGANGIAFYHGALYVATTERGIILRIPVSPAGSPAAEPVVAAVVPDPDPRFAMFGPPTPDGLALDVHGNFVVPVINRHAVVRISADGSTWETLATANDGLVAPPSVAFGTGKGERTSIFVTSMGFPVFGGPSLIKIETGIPGLPLP